MKLISPKYGMEIALEENKIHVLVIEKQEIMLEMTENLWRQSKGSEGIFLLSEGDKIFNFSKDVCVILNLFAMDCNERKILNKLYQEILNVGIEEMNEQIVEMNGNVVSCLENLLGKIPYSLDMTYELDVMGLLKLYDVKIDDNSENMVEKIINYIRCMHQICHISVFVFANLKQYLNEEQILTLQEFVMYEKVYLILVESIQKSILECEKYWIFDKDMCIINTY